MRRKVLIVLGAAILVLAVALILVRPNAPSGNTPGQDSPHSINQ